MQSIMRDEKVYVLNQLEGYLAAARQEFRAYRGDGWADIPDKEIDGYIERNGYPNEIRKSGLIIIPVNGSRFREEQRPTSFYRIPNDPARLISFRQSVKSAYQEHTGNLAKPADKPKGKDPALIEQEAQEEVDRYYSKRDSLRQEYLYVTGEGLEKAKQDVQKWIDIEDKVDNREITLKSLAPEFGGKVPSRYNGRCGYMVKQHNMASLSGRISAAHDHLANIEKRLQDVQKTICEAYPSLLNELTV